MAKPSEHTDEGAFPGALSTPGRTRRRQLHSASGSPRKVVFLRDFCTRPFGSSCTRCIETCPKGAIAFANAQAAIDSQACTSCGMCVGACDAFSLANISAEGVRTHMRKIALSGQTVILTCSYVLPRGFDAADNVVVLPCLAMLSPELLTVSLAEGQKLSVAVSFDACESCARTKGRGMDSYATAIEAAEAATERAIGFSDDVPERTEESTLLETLAQSEPADRRETFEALKDQALDIASGSYRARRNESLQEAREQSDRWETETRIGGAAGSPEANAYAEGGFTREVLFPRQRMVLEAANASDAVAVRLTVTLSSTDAALCENDLSCAKACPTGARQPSPENGTLRFARRLCTGCGLCVSACAHGAVSLREACAGELLPGAIEDEPLPAAVVGANGDSDASPVPATVDDEGAVDVIPK